MKKLTPDEMFAQLTEEAIRSYDEWQFIYENGCSDPNWEDGVNLNLVRNHLIYYKRKISNLCKEHGFEKPQVLFRKLPSRVPTRYMAGAAGLKQKAADLLYEIESSQNYHRLLEWQEKISSKQSEQIGLTRFLKRMRYDRREYESDNFLAMRNFVRNGDYCKDQITELLKAAEKLPSESFQLTLFSVDAS